MREQQLPTLCAYLNEPAGPALTGQCPLSPCCSSGSHRLHCDLLLPCLVALGLGSCSHACPLAPFGLHTHHGVLGLGAASTPGKLQARPFSSSARVPVDIALLGAFPDQSALTCPSGDARLELILFRTHFLCSLGCTYCASAPLDILSHQNQQNAAVLRLVASTSDLTRPQDSPVTGHAAHARAPTLLTPNSTFYVGVCGAGHQSPSIILLGTDWHCKEPRQAHNTTKI